ncbi:MAG: pyridoxamine 5'-phosphate oxidase [Hyphomicrobiaceae bacterium]
MSNKTQPEYYGGAPDEKFVEADDPFALFGKWMEEARDHEINDANAMSLATVDADGLPNVRVVLLKGIDDGDFVFYTNHESQKGQELLGQGKAAVGFYWKSLRRQVRVRGSISTVSDADADAYFAMRPRGSRIGAWASAQSRPLSGRVELEAAVEKYDAAYPGEDIPRPPHWSGFRLTPVEIEFWHDRPFRLHDRVVFRRDDGNAEWTRMCLYP